ncbi:MAG: hypothetical protein KC519_20475, partial [Anaerolineae bacterium]|nr:hypothetical protein [Anaerolineae bacterium]
VTDSSATDKTHVWWQVISNEWHGSIEGIIREYSARAFAAIAPVLEAIDIKHSFHKYIDLPTDEYVERLRALDNVRMTRGWNDYAGARQELFNTLWDEGKISDYWRYDKTRAMDRFSKSVNATMDALDKRRKVAPLHMEKSEQFYSEVLRQLPAKIE